MSFSLKFSFGIALTDFIHGDNAIGRITEGPGASQILSTDPEDVGQALHQASHLHLERVEEGSVDSGPVFAVHLLPLDPVTQDGASIVLWLMPGDVRGACRHLVDSGSVGSIRRI